MLLLDVGNTNISAARSMNGIIVDSFTCSPRVCVERLSDMVDADGAESMLVSSVVPAVSRKLRSFSKKHGIKYYQCGCELTIPVKNLYDDPSEVGMDRLLNVYAVNRLYAGRDVRLVIDLGTALTFDFITKRGAYHGGLIFPGMKIALQGLLDTCALLPDRLELKPTRRLKARNTAECINNGVDYGYSFLISGLIAHIKQKDADLKTLITGGGAEFLIKKICKIDYYDKLLALKGLNELARELL